ncbi:MAG: hypothetical protein HWD59_07110 [Coxiellaceae bacterium]|nr:MAG: hypothetical protein HWD59_07110 [Coxiellaceae bacterium]
MNKKVLLSIVAGAFLVGAAPASFAGSCYHKYHHYCNKPVTCHFRWVCGYDKTFFYPKSIVENAARMGYTVLADRCCQQVHREGCFYKVIAVDNVGQKWVLIFNPATGRIVEKRAI